jgi:hypothetical protein
MLSLKSQQIAVIGAGIAGAVCAQRLTAAGHAVHVFDKSRGPGGRLATRRVEWVDREGRTRTARLDHGAVGITARSADLQAFVDQALHAGWLAEWAPPRAADSLPGKDGSRLYLPVSDMPALCRHLLAGIQTTWSFAIDGLHHGTVGWQLRPGGEEHPARFDAVVLALPPAQAAPLLHPHRTDWAERASAVVMRPCWTLMGIADAPADAADPSPDWELARPLVGPLACVLRSDSRPGRSRVPRRVHWVAHARTDWSRHHLEQPAAWVQQQLHAALEAYLGQAIEWQYSVVHRWRYALPPERTTATARGCWWDAAQGLGACGDFLGGPGVEGVEGAWLSAQSLCAELLRTPSVARGAADALAA